MKREILIVAAALWTGSAMAADTGHCDSKPFTLKKPAVAAPKPVPPAPAAANPAPKTAAPNKAVKGGKSGYVIGCKQPKA